MPSTAPSSVTIPLVRRALLSRATFHPRSEDFSELQSLGYEGWLERQLAPDSIPDVPLDARLAAYPWRANSAAELRAQFGSGGGWTLSEQSKAMRLLRAKESQRQLFERVVDFWNDHFNVPFTAQDANYLRPPYEEHVIRAHALGTFPELLHAVAKSPAMGAFLDQDSNRTGAPNENYARELLELHTLGEGTGYTELDVREVARCFTGWGYVRHWQSGEFGRFRFDPSAHDFGAKTVLGNVIPAGGGVEDGEMVLGLLLRDPRAARFLAKKLVGWFLGEAAALSAPVVQRVEDAYNSTGGDITEMVRATLAEEVLLAVQPWRRPKLKQPFHFAVSLMRAVGARVTNPSTAVYALAGLGQVPFEWPDPDGYPDEASAWVATLTPRWRFASQLLNGWTSWAQVDAVDLSALMAGADRTHWGRGIAAVLTAGAMSGDDRAAIQSFIDQSPGSDATKLVGAFELGASSPSFQLF